MSETGKKIFNNIKKTFENRQKALTGATGDDGRFMPIDEIKDSTEARAKASEVLATTLNSEEQSVTSLAEGYKETANTYAVSRDHLIIRRDRIAAAGAYLTELEAEIDTDLETKIPGYVPGGKS